MVFNRVIPQSMPLSNWLVNYLFPMKKKVYISHIYIDFKKAFDAVDNTILLKKLSMYGIKATSLKWLVEPKVTFLDLYYFFM